MLTVGISLLSLFMTKSLLRLSEPLKQMAAQYL